jgi:DNA-binding transcriptional ArsR family regulator
VTGGKVIVGPGARDVVVRLGPVAWVVLERMAQQAMADGDDLVVCASVRSLAAELGLAKDTVAWALRRLRRAGLVEFVGERFERGSYRLTVPADVLRVDDSVRGSRSPRSRYRLDKPTLSQLSLLDRD